MTFPAASNPAARAPRTGVPYSALIVDDDKFLLTVLIDPLRTLGISPTATAGHGSTGLLELNRMTQPTEPVVCDLGIPGTDGSQFMEQHSQRGCAGGAILVSGMASHAMKSAALMAPFYRPNTLDALAKPVGLPALQAAIDKLA